LRTPRRIYTGIEPTFAVDVMSFDQDELGLVKVRRVTDGMVTWVNPRNLVEP